MVIINLRGNSFSDNSIQCFEICTSAYNYVQMFMIYECACLPGRHTLIHRILFHLCKYIYNHIYIYTRSICNMYIYIYYYVFNIYIYIPRTSKVCKKKVHMEKQGFSHLCFFLGFVPFSENLAYGQCLTHFGTDWASKIANAWRGVSKWRDNCIVLTWILANVYRCSMAQDS